MKIVLTTTFLVAVLAIGLLGLNNSSSSSNIIGNANAQMDQGTGGGMNQNDTGKMMNATLAFAQEGNDTMSMGNESSTMMMNATLPMSLEGNNTAKPME